MEPSSMSNLGQSNPGFICHCGHKLLIFLNAVLFRGQDDIMSLSHC